MKRSDLAVGIEWLGTLGAAGFWTVTGVWRRYPNLTTVMVVPSRAHLLTGLGLICTALIARRYRTGRFFPRTRFDFPLLLFLLSALLGWLCAYNRELGLIKLIFILSALSVFYLLAGADLVFARGFACGLVLLAAFLSVLAIVQYDFADSLGQLSFLVPLGKSVDEAAPEYGLRLPNPNTIAGILELSVPFVLLWIYSALSLVRQDEGSAPPRDGERSRLGRRITRQVRLVNIGITISILLCIASGLFLTRSRGAWSALAGTAGLGLLVWFASSLSGRLLSDSRLARRVGMGFALFVVLIGLGTYGAVLTRPDWLHRVPGGRGALAYADLFQDGFYLARDYLITGAGLGAFQMVYSSYQHLLHVGFIPDAHNLYLQVWFEQGILGIGSLLWMGGTVVWSMARQNAHESRITRAAGWAIIVILTHGLMDVTLYGYEPWSILYLFVPFGLFVAGERLEDSMQATAYHRLQGAGKTVQRRRALLLVAIIGAVIIWRHPILSTAFSNFGALEQTRIELGAYAWPDWPIQDEVRRQVDLDRPVGNFKRSLAYDPTNAAANRRLGMIALSRGDYSHALGYLEAAFAKAPGDNATRQLLGEAFLVNGQLDKGVSLWSGASNAQGQLDIRAWWYSHIGDDRRAVLVKEAIDAVTSR